MPGLIKICGVKSVETGVAAAKAGADLIGFVFVQKSPRYIAPEAAEELVTEIKRACEDLGFDAPH
ncbi:MAG TPA: hypothetical protein P5072_08830, partial [Parvularculaceae bacterium]|nr:hypothetical protein [Parvularculaceae bacterium]